MTGAGFERGASIARPFLGRHIRYPATRTLVAAFSLVAAFLGSSAVARADDVVRLKNGGRIRGRVMEEQPDKGVTLLLEDGTVKSIRSSDVKSVEYGPASPAPPQRAPPTPAPPAPRPAPAPPAPPTPDAQVGVPQNPSVAGSDAAQCIAANEQGIALRKDTKLIAARAQWLSCVAKNCPTEIHNECTRRAAEADDAIPSIAFEAKDPTTGSDLVAVKVTVDGHPLLDRLDATATPMDAGEHVFTFQAAGLPAVEKRFVLREGEKRRHESITFSAPVVTVTPQSDGSVPRTIGYVVGAVGLGAVALAIYEQATALGRQSDSSKAAASPDPNTEATVGPIHDQAVLAQTYAIISGLVGVGAIGTSLYLILANPAPSQAPKASWLRARPLIGAGTGGFVLEGAF